MNRPLVVVLFGLVQEETSDPVCSPANLLASTMQLSSAEEKAIALPHSQQSMESNAAGCTVAIQSCNEHATAFRHAGSAG